MGPKRRNVPDSAGTEALVEDELALRILIYKGRKICSRGGLYALCSQWSMSAQSATLLQESCSYGLRKCPKRNTFRRCPGDNLRIVTPGENCHRFVSGDCQL